MKIIYSNDMLTPEEVVKFFSLTGQSHSIYKPIIIHKEVVKKAEELGITVSDEQLQLFADQFRTLKGLYSAQEMMDFLKSSGLTEDDFEVFCEASLLTIDLKEHFADTKKVEEYFINNRSDFDLARISTIVVKEESLADEIAMQITEDGEDFHTLARRHSLDEATKHYGGHLGPITRKMLSPDISAKVFNANAGDLLGPFKKDVYIQLILVEEVIKAELTDNVKEAIKERIFEQWVSRFYEDGMRVDSE